MMANLEYSPQQSVKIKKNNFLTGIWVLLIFFMLFSSVSLAQEESAQQKYDALEASVAKAQQNELKEIENLKTQLSEVEKSKKTTQENIDTNKIQLPIYNNLLLQSETPIPALEKAWREIQNTIRELSERITDFSTRKNTVAQRFNQNREQVALTEKQIADIQSENAASKEISTIKEQLQILLNHLSEKQKLLSKLDTTYLGIIDALTENRQTFSDLSEKFDKNIQTRKKQALLERKTSLVNIGLKQILADFKDFSRQLGAVSKPSFWSGQLAFVWKSGGFYLVSFVLLFFIIQGINYRMRKYIIRFKDHPKLKRRFWSPLTLLIIKKSIFLFGSTLFLYIYAHAGPFESKPPIVWAGLNILMVWLFSEVCIDAIQSYCGEEATSVPQKPAFYFRLLISMVRWFGITYILFSWLGSSNSTVLTIWRLILEICLYAWNLFFWSALHKSHPPDTAEWSSRQTATITALKFLSFSIVLIALVLELSGYGLLALYWLTSWGRTAVVVLWSMLLFFVLLEWNPIVEKYQDAPDGTTGVPKKSIRWVIVQFLMLVWFANGIILLIFAWGGKQSFLLKVFGFLRHSYQVGNMNFSLMGLVVAILILLLTQFVARVWQQVFRQNILNQSGMEEGLQDSITTISVYVVWAVGILIALNAFGFNATSLTVVLGALGIGLGFGLQAIFNNFVSGIILLFERPIQVGDDIEVGGRWATVRKINVRATVVQTYDNASLIIPNSDLISSQVTNWSFKDKRLRRNVEVGVAYGSDVELVRDTLMEVAEKTPRILKLPKPDVIFKEFGDSALIFVLRIWSRVEYFYSVESDVRYEITRLFREKNIEIAFPQRDLHLRSGFDQKKPDVLEKELPVLAEDTKNPEV